MRRYTECYLTIEDRYPVRGTGNCTVTRVTLRYPETIGRNERVVRVSLELPDDFFSRLVPDATIVVPPVARDGVTASGDIP